MLVCSVSQRPRHRAVAAELLAAATADDASTTGLTVFATLVDDPAAVGDIIDAYLGEMMLEAASAADAPDAYLPATYTADITETVTASESQSAALAVLYATLDGTPSNATLSNGNLTVTHSNTNQGGGRSASNKSSGKYYFEVTIGVRNGNQDAISIMLSTGNYGSVFSANGNVACMLATSFFAAQNLYIGGGGTSRHTGAITTGSVVCFAVDLDNKNCWVRVNNGNWNGRSISLDNPVGNVGGLTGGLASGSYAPMLVFDGGVANDTYTINCGQSAFAYTLPSGFAGWPV